MRRQLATTAAVKGYNCRPGSFPLHPPPCPPNNRPRLAPCKPCNEVGGPVFGPPVHGHPNALHACHIRFSKHIYPDRSGASSEQLYTRGKTNVAYDIRTTVEYYLCRIELLLVSSREQPSPTSIFVARVPRWSSSCEKLPTMYNTTPGACEPRQRH